MRNDRFENFNRQRDIALEEPVGGDLPREPAGVGDPQRIGRYERAS